MRLRLLTLIFFPLVLLFAPLALAAHASDETTSPAPTESSSASPDDAEGTQGGDEADEDEPLPDGPYIRVRLFDQANDDEPVAGVDIAVTDEDGEVVGEDVTDEQGIAVIPIPGAGTFTAELDENTLPDGIELAPQFDNTRTVDIILASATNLQFPIGTQEVVEVPFSEKLITALTSGVKFGLIVALAALGLSLIFGTTGLTNFAHGELITLGAVLTYFVNIVLGVPVVWAGLATIFLSALFGWLQEIGLWRPLRRRGTGLIAMMIVSIGLGLLLRNVYQYTIGSSRKSLSQYVSQSRQDYWIFALADKEIAIMGTSIIVITLTCVMLMTTRLGKSMRAVADNPALAASSGMRVDSVISSVWILGTALTGLSGVLLAVNSQVNFLMGFKLLLLVFAAVTLGGLGTIWGALFGSMVIGIMVEAGPLFGVPSSIKEVGALVVLILVLLIRPQGILGRRERIG